MTHRRWDSAMAVVRRPSPYRVLQSHRRAVIPTSILAMLVISGSGRQPND